MNCGNYLGISIMQVLMQDPQPHDEMVRTLPWTGGSTIETVSWILRCSSDDQRTIHENENTPLHHLHRLLKGLWPCTKFIYNEFVETFMVWEGDACHLDKHVFGHLVPTRYDTSSQFWEWTAGPIIMLLLHYVCRPDGALYEVVSPLTVCLDGYIY